jgi:PPOX class probable F420-dependent enzyme
MTGDADSAKAYFAGLSGATYIVLTTFRRSGAGVPTPVHVVVDHGGSVAYFRTWDPSGKSKRLRRTADVEVAPSTIRGRPLGDPIRAEARLLSGEESQHAARLLAARHPVLHGRLIPWVHRRRGWTTQQYRLEAPG